MKIWSTVHHASHEARLRANETGMAFSVFRHGSDFIAAPTHIHNQTNFHWPGGRACWVHVIVPDQIRKSR